MAANPGDVEFTPGGPTLYLLTAPSINWAAYGALTGATCQFTRTNAPTSTPFPTTSCGAVVANAPVVNTASAPTFTAYAWNTAPLVSGDGAYRVTYTPSFVSFGSPVATRDFVIDSVSPVVTASAPNGVTTDNTPQLGYTMQDVNPDRVECAIDPVDPLDPGSYAVCPPSPYSPPALADGEHTYYVVGYDLAQQLSVAVKVFTVDATGPSILVTGLSEGEILTSAWPPLSVSYSDAGTGAQNATCAYDSNAPTSCNDAGFLNAPLPDGAHTLTVVATDVAGNVSSRVIHFTVDTSGGLTQGLTAPKKAKFAVERGKLSGSKYTARVSMTFAMPAGAPATACKGSAKVRVLVKKKQIGAGSPKFKRSGSACTTTATIKLSKKFKGKKLSIRFAYNSGPIKAFTLSGNARL